MFNTLGLRQALAPAIADFRDRRAPRVRHARPCSMAACLCLLITGHVLAEVIDDGVRIAAMCASCHRLNGGDRGMPPIAGIGEAGLAGALLAYRSGERRGPIMRAIALSLNDAEIADVARFLGGRKAAPP